MATIGKPESEEAASVDGKGTDAPGVKLPESDPSAAESVNQTPKSGTDISTLPVLTRPPINRRSPLQARGPEIRRPWDRVRQPHDQSDEDSSSLLVCVLTQELVNHFFLYNK